MERVAQYRNKIDMAATGSEKRFAKTLSRAKLIIIGLSLLFDNKLTDEEFNEVNDYGGVTFRNL